MIVNLAEETKRIIDNSQLDVRDIEHVTFYNKDDDELQKCSYLEFIEIAEDINYTEHDVTFNSVDAVSKSLEIVATSWWLRRDLEVSGWLYSPLPYNDRDLTNGDSELDVAYIIEDDDLHDEEYKEMVSTTRNDYPYVKASKITIDGITYNIDTKTGVDRVIKNNNVAIILASDGNYWTEPYDGEKDIRMLFEPELVKLVMEGSYEDMDTFNTDWISSTLNINTAGFDDHSFKTLRVEWLPIGVNYNITAMQTNNAHGCLEKLIIAEPNQWMIS